MIHLLPSGCKYINIPKCGSSSIREALGKGRGHRKGKNPNRDWSPVQIPWDGSKYVAIVRDPLARFVSCVHYLNRWFCEPKYEPFAYETWIAMDGKYPHKRMAEHLLEQHKFIQDPSKFYKIYDISEIDQFFADHELGPVKHTNRNTSIKMPVTDEVIEWVKFKYQKDYEMLSRIRLRGDCLIY